MGATQLASAYDANAPLHVPNMPIEEYHADRAAISCTGLKKVLQTPAHLIAYLQGRDKVTPAKLFGAAYHCASLEPDIFARTYVVEPEKPADAVDTVTDIKKLLKEAGLPQTGNRAELIARLKEANPNVLIWAEHIARLTSGKKTLKQADMDAINQMIHILRADERFNLLTEDGSAEQTFFWTDPDTGVRCKARTDWLGSLAIVDLKKTEDASKPGFTKSVANYGYDIQAAFYVDGVAAYTGERLPFVFAAQESEAPYTPALYQASEAMIETGRRKYKQALEVFAKCQHNGIWHGYQPDGLIEEIDLPRWAQ